MIERGGKRAVVLTENVLFIILNVAFLAIMLIFLVSNTGTIAYFEQAYAKQIALIIDSAKPGMEINIDISKGLKEDGEWFSKNFQDSVKITGNVVTVKLSKDSGYSYSFFNKVNPSVEVGPNGNAYILVR